MKIDSRGFHRNQQTHSRTEPAQVAVPQEQSDAQLDEDLVCLFREYKDCESWRNQLALQREIEFTLSANQLSDSMQKIQSRLSAVFRKNNEAWERQQAPKSDSTGTPFEWNLRTHEQAKAKPVTASNLFQADDILKQRNLATFQERPASPSPIEQPLTDMDKELVDPERVLSKSPDDAVDGDIGDEIEDPERFLACFADPLGSKTSREIDDIEPYLCGSSQSSKKLQEEKLNEEVDGYLLIGK